MLKVHFMCGMVSDLVICGLKSMLSYVTQMSWRITKYNKSFLPFAVHLWNSLDKETQSITEYERFKDALEPNVREKPLFLYIPDRNRLLWPNSG